MRIARSAALALMLTLTLPTLAAVRPSRSQKVALGVGVVFGALAHKQVGQVFKAAASSVVHPISAVKKVWAKTK